MIIKMNLKILTYLPGPVNHKGGWNCVALWKWAEIKTLVGRRRKEDTPQIETVNLPFISIKPESSEYSYISTKWMIITRANV